MKTEYKNKSHWFKHCTLYLEDLESICRLWQETLGVEPTIEIETSQHHKYTFDNWKEFSENNSQINAKVEEMQIYSLGPLKESGNSYRSLRFEKTVGMRFNATTSPLDYGFYNRLSQILAARASPLMRYTSSEPSRYAIASVPSLALFIFLLLVLRSENPIDALTIAITYPLASFFAIHGLIRAKHIKSRAIILTKTPQSFWEKHKESIIVGIIGSAVTAVIMSIPTGIARYLLKGTPWADFLP